MNHYRKRTAPYGFPFLDTQSTKILRQKINAACEFLVSEGYEEVTPASLDYPETFLSRSQADTFHVRDHLGEELALRSDVTVQLIKGFANFLESSQKKEESKFCYSVRVFRDVKKNYPALREIFQIGAEEVGMEEKKAIPNLIRLAHKIYAQVFAENIIVIAGDIRVFNFFAEYLKEEISAEALRSLLIEKDIPSFEKILCAKFTPELAASLAGEILFPPVADDWKKKIQTWQHNFTDKQDFFQKFSAMLAPLLDLQAELARENFELRIEPLLLRKTTYYSGILFEGYCEKASNPPLRGGSYDNLVSQYSNIDLPASGFALDVSPF